MTELVALTAGEPKLKLVIKEDKVGFYLIVYPHDSGRSIADYLYDNLEGAFAGAERRYGVARTSWGNAGK
jgi:hypothetical protein